jgi:hypothetical protein
MSAQGSLLSPAIRIVNLAWKLQKIILLFLVAKIKTKLLRFNALETQRQTGATFAASSIVARVNKKRVPLRLQFNIELQLTYKINFKLHLALFSSTRLRRPHDDRVCPSRADTAHAVRQPCHP